MAKSIETEYYSDATATCSNCGSVYTFGMTKQSLTTEICGNCHPFYTGQDTIIDTAGRIEKFNARSNKAQSGVTKIKKVQKTRKFKQSIYDLSDNSQEMTVEVKGGGVIVDQPENMSNE
jgi:large subunit ribosomal protein L31